MPLSQLRRVRWAVRATLVLGVAASVVANVLHAQDNPISQAIAAWPPLALLLTVELISRVPVHRRSLAFARLLATAIIAGIAAWVSYWHMAGVAARYGETGASPYLLPLSVDGLIVVASICLVELAGRIQSLQSPQPLTVPGPQPLTNTQPLTSSPAEAGPQGLEIVPEPAPAKSKSLANELAGLLPAKAPAAGKTAPGASIPELTPSATRRPRTAAARSTTPSTRTTATARATSKPRKAPAAKTPEA